MRWTFAAIALAAGCKTPAPAPPATAPAPGYSLDAAPPDTGTDAGPAVDEAHARWLLAERFRAAGYRVLEDVTIDLDGAPFTLDGYDPDAAVGYEYVAPGEPAPTTDPAHILFIGPADERTLVRAADEFLETR